MPKLTFSLDEATVQKLRQVSARTRKPQSQVVREAIAQFAEREDLLAPDERDRLLDVLRTIRGRPATRTPSAVREELQEIRRSRRAGWSRGASLTP